MIKNINIDNQGQLDYYIEIGEIKLIREGVISITNNHSLRTIFINGIRTDRIILHNLGRLKSLVCFSTDHIEMSNLPFLKRMIISAINIDLKTKIPRLSSLRLDNRITEILSLNFSRIPNNCYILTWMYHSIFAEINMYRWLVYHQGNNRRGDKLLMEMRLENYRARLEKAKRYLEKIILKRKILSYWNSFFYSQTRNGINRFCWLAKN